MFKRTTFIIVALVSLGLLGGCITNGHLDAVGDLYTAATISKGDLVQMSKDMRAQGDKENKVAADNNKHAVRLARLTNRLKKEDGLDLNFKVYLTNDVNANATADGSIRVYAGLMDMMTDNELFFVIGHEIGHVKGGDSLDKVRMAYASSGAIKAVSASASSSGYGLSNSQLGGLLHTVLNAQFSQTQESDSDAYGYELMKKYKVDTKAAVSALKKLDTLGSSGGVMSSHPNAGARAAAIQAKIDADKKT